MECVKNLNKKSSAHLGSRYSGMTHREAASNSPTGPKTYLFLSPHSIKEEIRREKIYKRNGHSEMMRQARNLTDGYNARRLKDIILLLRKNNSKVLQDFLH